MNVTVQAWTNLFLKAEGAPKRRGVRLKCATSCKLRGVGKSSLLLRFAHGTFVDSYLCISAWAYAMDFYGLLMNTQWKFHKFCLARSFYLLAYGLLRHMARSYSSEGFARCFCLCGDWQLNNSYIEAQYINPRNKPWSQLSVGRTCQ